MLISEIEQYLEPNKELHGEYCIKGTKIFARTIVKWLKQDRSVKSIVNQLNKAKITERDVEACWAWGVARKQEQAKQRLGVQERTKVFSENLRRIRKERGISQAILAYRVGLSRQYYWKIENGYKEPQVSTLYGLCRELGCTLGNLLDGE